MLVNKMKGEVAIHILGKDRILRPTFEACVLFEEQVGYSIIKALNEIKNGNISLRMLSAAIAAGLHGAGDSSVAVADIGNAVHRAGIVKFTGPIIEFLTYAIAGEEALSKMGKEEAVGESPSTSSGE